MTDKLAFVAVTLMGMLTACGGGANGASPATQSSTVSTGTGGNVSLRFASPTPNEGFSGTTSYATDYCSSQSFPAQWKWRNATTQLSASGATSGQPLVRHIRAGIEIARYSQLSGYRSVANNINAHDTSVGPFRRFPYTQWQDGDVFEIYPAVYEGEDQQIFIGPNTQNDSTYAAGAYDVPKNITIRGITVNGVRPVIKLPSTGASNANFGQGLIYIDRSENITIENLEISSNNTGLGSLGKGAIYINGSKNLTLRDIKVSGFANRSQNGIFGTSLNSGTLFLENIELDSNGGGGGPEHNIYINASSVDSNFTVRMVGSWSHDSYYGHLFKSRAQINILEGNYFQGSRSVSGEMRESWLVDIPEGGTLIARNNIFAKNFSGNSTNGAAITYAVEKSLGTFDANRTWKVLIENNTFVAFTKYFDTQNHAVYPMFYNTAAPVLPSNMSMKNNLFVGYCQTPSPNLGSNSYFGTDYVMTDFNAIDEGFRPRVPLQGRSGSAVGSPTYNHQNRTVLRQGSAVGARD
jgi:hypothetical protein